jgi:hypothetical protein
MGNQLKFIWEHLGAFRKIIIAGCVLMTQTNDILGWLPDSIKSKISWLFPCWPWYWWLIIALMLIAAFSIEESYVRQHPEDTNTKKNGFPAVVLACIGIAWLIALVICHSRAVPIAPPPIQNPPPPTQIPTAPPSPQPQQPIPQHTAKLPKPKVVAVPPQPVPTPTPSQPAPTPTIPPGVGGG